MPRRASRLPVRRRAAALLSIGLATALALAGCSDDSGNGNRSGPTTSDCGVEGGGRCQPKERRVDTGQPTFSNPTAITNPLFPMSSLTQVIQRGVEGGKPARVEITLLPQTKTIRWKGQDVETVVSQFVGYSDGRVVEIALDFFAQADDGAVWYFGEDVFNYRNGRVEDNEGTWLAGRDGPPGMIMPADPQVGDVYRPENVPGLVFEEVTVKATNLTLPGPRGPVEGSIRIQEHLQDDSLESKVFAPGYGEFKIRTADELIFMALAVPTDAVAAPTPAELEELVTGATDVFDAAASGDWTAAATAAGTMTSAWDAYREGTVPEQLEIQANEALDELGAAVDAQDTAGARRAAVDVMLAALDLELQYRPPTEVDVGRLDAWARRVAVDAAADNVGGVRGDVAVMEAIRDRIAHTLEPADLTQLDDALGALRAATDNGDLGAATEAATQVYRIEANG